MCIRDRNSEGPHTIIAVGGDGTVNEILNGLSFDGPVTLGYIPTGSGNDLARSLRPVSYTHLDVYKRQPL